MIIHMNNTSLVVTHMKYGLSDACYLFFSTLANPTRLGILELLRKSPKNVTQIAEHLNQEQSMISHNLKSLTRCRFVFVKRKGKKRIYSLNRETLEPMYEIIDNHTKKYCPSGGCLERLRSE
jgi:DNA-binding transcriptional ArsR family regulator